jgi:predicted ATPase/DNA-binding winged helix-turn-helix (wHTH) protein
LGQCEVDFDRRELRVLGAPAPIGGRAFDILELLVRSAGALVRKEELMGRVWPGATVSDNALQVHISAPRKALGAQRTMLKTESGRGYRLLGEWTLRDQAATGQPVFEAPPIAKRGGQATNLPGFITPLIGRSIAAGLLRNLVSAYRLVTLTGPGGIGKTTLALQLARELLPEFGDGAWLVELAPLSSPDLVPSAVAGVLGLNLGGETTAAAVARVIHEKNLLLVLDNCEHVIDGAANLAETLLRFCPRVTAGLWGIRLPGFAARRPGPDDEPDDILGRSAVELFVARSRASGSEFSAHAENLSSIAAICRHLDGIPLAIEFPAARVAVLGVEQVAAALGERFTLLTSGRRTAVPRHRTLRAALDWSYELLPENERIVLRRLAVFAGSFTLQAASAVAAAEDIAPSEVADCFAKLVEKSLVTAGAPGVGTRFRLLETTGAYALEMLAEAGEFDTAARRHATRYLDLFESAEAEAELQTRPTNEWLEEFRPRIDNLRTALDWAFLPGGDTAIGVALTAAAVPLWMELSLMEECRSRVEQALTALAPDSDRDPRSRMKLFAALAASLMYTRGAISEVRVAGEKALEVAESLGDAEYQLRSLFGLHSFHINSGHQGVALTLAERFLAVAADRSQPDDRPVGERLIGTSRHYLGDLVSARQHLERVLDRHDARARTWQIARFEVDQRAAAQVYLARVLWLQGLPDQAMRTAEGSVADARAANHAISLGLALARAACPIALFNGDLDMAGYYVEMLLDHSTRHALARWFTFARSYQAILVIRRGDLDTGLQMLRAAFDDPAAARPVAFVTCVMAEALGNAAQVGHGLAVIEEAIARAEETEERWVMAELLRIKGELVLLRGVPGASPAAEGLSRQALDWARRQGALSWELRSAISLARLWCTRPRHDAARELLIGI